MLPDILATGSQRFQRYREVENEGTQMWYMPPDAWCWFFWIVLACRMARGTDQVFIHILLRAVAQTSIGEREFRYFRFHWWGPKKKTSDFIGGDLKHFWWSVVFRNGKNLHQNKLFHGLQTVRFLNGRNLLQKKILCLIGPYFLFENLHQNRQLTHWWNWLSILLLNTILKSRQCQIFDGTETLRQPPLQRSQTRSNKRLIYSGFSWFSLWLHIAICIHRQPAVLTKSNINKFPMMKSLALQTVENLRNHTWMMPAARSIGCTWRLGCSSSTSWINRQMWISHRAWSNAKMPSIGGRRIRGLHRNCIPISDPIKVKWLLRHLGFSWLTLFESGELCISHLNRVSPVSPVHVSVTSMWATAWIYQLEVVFGKWVFIRVNRLCWLSQFSIYRWIYHSFSLI